MIRITGSFLSIVKLYCAKFICKKFCCLKYLLYFCPRNQEVMIEENLQLSAQVCFPLYAASRKITQQYAKYLTPLDLTYPQYLVLLVLWEEGSLTVNAIGEKYHIKQNFATAEKIDSAMQQLIKLAIEK